MNICFHRAGTFDDLLRDVIVVLREHGEPFEARRGSFTELRGVMLELENPRARLSRTETKGRPFSALGEFCWYLAGRSDLESIRYYLKDAYRPEDVLADGTLPGAYGPRLVGDGEDTQLERVVRLLDEHPTTRRAVLQLFDANDLRPEHNDVPCTCAIQFLRREGRLHAVTYMRSNDVLRGFPHDVFCFTLLQEWVARRLGDEPGVYKHAVGSLHLYQKDEPKAVEFLGEGYQSTLAPMPPMSPSDPHGALAALLEAEAALRVDPPRVGEAAAIEERLDPYWADLVRLLTAYRSWKDQHTQGILEVKRRMSSDTFHTFLDRLTQIT